MSSEAAAAYVDRFRVAAPSAAERAASLAVAGVFGTLHALTDTGLALSYAGARRQLHAAHR